MMPKAGVINAPKKGAAPEPKQLRTWEEKQAALIAKGWAPAGDGKVQGWEENREVTGVFVKMKDGKFGPLAVIRQDDGTALTIGCPTILADRLANIAPGCDVFIRCLGQLVTEKGNTAWSFSVLSRPHDDGNQETLPF